MKMIDIFLSVDEYIALKSMILRIVILYILTCLAVGIDFWSGIAKCKRIGLPYSSREFRRTIIKLNQYLLFMVLFTVVDFALIISGLFPLFNLSALPFFTLFALLVVWFIEVRSVWENTDKGHKKDIEKAVGALGKLIRNRGDIEGVIKELEKTLNETDKGK